METGYKVIEIEWVEHLSIPPVLSKNLLEIFTLSTILERVIPLTCALLKITHIIITDIIWLTSYNSKEKQNYCYYCIYMCMWLLFSCSRTK